MESVFPRPHQTGLNTAQSWSLIRPHYVKLVNQPSKSTVTMDSVFPRPHQTGLNTAQSWSLIRPHYVKLVYLDGFPLQLNQFANKLIFLNVLPTILLINSYCHFFYLSVLIMSFLFQILYLFCKSIHLIVFQSQIQPISISYHHSKCDQCDQEWITNSLKTACYYDVSQNCGQVIFPSSSTQPVCLLCKIGFTLSTVAISATESFSICLPTAVSIPHCALHTSIPDSTLYTCQQCKTGYEKIDLTVDGKTVTKCVSTPNYVENCDHYSEAPLSCTYKCLDCKAGFKLASVHTLSGRVQPRCLNKVTEYLPNCGLFVQIAGNYYCKHTHCATPAIEVKIGSETKQIACTTFTLFTASRECTVYERPLETDTQLKCSVCKDGNAQLPYCTTIE